MNTAETTTMTAESTSSSDDVELEKEGDKLLWQVDFDDQGGKYGKEVHIDATSRDVVAR